MIATRPEGALVHDSEQVASACANPPKPSLRLAVFDLDGTLKARVSPWRLLHEALGVWSTAAEYRQRYVQGAIDYYEWARLDASLWEGVELARAESLFAGSPYRPGVRALFQFLRESSVPTAIISTGLDVQASRVAQDLGVWRTVTNELLVSCGRLTGKVRVHVTEDNKGSIMEALCNEMGVARAQCMAAGDGPADIALFARAGLSVAVCPQDQRVRAAATVVMETGDLATLVPLIERHFALPAR
jgi:phosphoserine phosphatase